MESTFQKIAGEALALSDQDRQDLLISLVHSFDNPESISEHEIRSRLEDVESGREAGIGHQDAMRRFRDLTL